MDMKLINLPIEIKNNIFLYLSHPCADIIKEVCLNIGCEEFSEFESKEFTELGCMINKEYFDTRLHFPTIYFNFLNYSLDKQIDDDDDDDDDD